MIIGAQVEALREERDEHEGMEKEGLRQDMRELAERLLGTDTERQGGMMDQVMDYLVRECQCDGPKSLMEQLNSLDKVAMQQWPHMELTSRMFYAVNMIRFHKAKAALGNG